MNRLPECVVVIDPNKEKNAIREARRMGIASVALIDTDCDPDTVDLPIPGNDDGLRSIEIIMQHLADAVLEGKSSASGVNKDAAPAAPAPAPTPAPAPEVVDKDAAEEAPAEETAAEEAAADDAPAEDAAE